LVGGNSYLGFKPIQAVLSFLTIIPTSIDSKSFNLKYVADFMYIFPLVGAIIGTLVGMLACLLSVSVTSFLLGVLTTAALVVITGGNHTDALADFADGLMTKGGREAKHRTMLEPSVGSAGTVSIVLYVAGMVVTLSSFHNDSTKLLISIILAEASAKYVMVLQAHVGTSAWAGLSSPFTESMKDRRKFLASTGIMIFILFITGLGYVGIMSLAVSLVVGIVLLYISKKSFGGITGDVMGASNELARLSSLVILSSGTI
jgi:adenosylcobinamide-GDP ribazoletransferase